MISDPLVFACTSDFAGKTRGKSFPLRELKKRLLRGVGWVPTNVQINCFDGIADSPFGSFGDLLLIPDEGANVEIDFEDGGSIERFMLGDIKTLEGKPWKFCTRSILKAALAKLKEVGGIQLVAAFEHEFQFKTGEAELGDGFGIGGFTKQRQFGEALMGGLRQAGLEPDTFMKEYGPNQYEVTNKPASDHIAADHAVILREVTRITAKRCESEISFAPILDPESVGNGVHIHMSFLDQNGEAATYDENGPAGMSPLTGSFIAGILKYLDSIVAITAPSEISYLRLTPHRWSAAYNNLGFRDREASVRICPITAKSRESAASQYNFEYRAADAAASPHLALAALIFAGAQGILDKLAPPNITEQDLSILSPDELEALGYIRLPETLEEALQRFEKNETVKNWFPAGFAQIYSDHKRSEIEYLSDKTMEEKCAIYSKVY